MQLDYATKPRLGGRMNFRLVAFLAAVSIPFVWFLYVFLNQVVTGGIQRHGNYTEVDLKSMGNFPFDGNDGVMTDIPKRIRDLDGQRVLLVGEMYAGREASSKVRGFELVYNIAKCCFGGPPKVQERVFVHVANGNTVPMFDGQVRTVGILHVHLIRSGDTIQSVFDMDLEKLEKV